jgi:hypothetical protein
MRTRIRVRIVCVWITGQSKRVHGGGADCLVQLEVGDLEWGQRCGLVLPVRVYFEYQAWVPRIGRSLAIESNAGPGNLGGPLAGQLEDFKLNAVLR